MIREMGRNTLAKVDHAEAQRLLDQGFPVRVIALRYDVSPQTIYEAIKRGTLKRAASVT